MKKIVFIVPSLGVGGAELVSLNICRFLNNKEFDYLFVSLNSCENSVNDIRARDWGIKVIYLNKNSGFDFMSIKKLRKIVKEYNPVIIHTHMGALIYGFLLNFRKVKHVHTIHCIPQNKRYYGYPLWLVRFVFKKKNIIPVCISEKQREETIKLFKLKNKEIPLIYNGIDTSLFKPKVLREKYIINVGSFTKIKNQKALIKGFYESLKESPSLSLVLIGDGPLRKDCEKLTEELGIAKKVIFTGVVSNVQDYLSSALLYVCTSITEANPLSFLEAMAAGLPIISTNVGGVSDIVSKNNGILLDSDLPESIKNSILFLLRNEEVYRIMSNNCIKQSANFDIKQCSHKYELIYSQ